MKRVISVIIVIVLLLPVCAACTPESTFHYNKLIWEDDFSGDEVNTENWRMMTGTGVSEGFPQFWGNNELQYYTAENAFVRNDQLVIRINRREYGGMAYTSARLTSSGSFSFTYGRVEARIKLPDNSYGIWPAFWMLPDGSPEEWEYGTWAASGELDIMENRSRIPKEVSCAAHYAGQWPDNLYSAGVFHFQEDKSVADFNIYTLEWFEDKLIWYVNGNEYFRLDDWFTVIDGELQGKPKPFDQPFCLILNAAVGGNFDGGIEPHDDFTEAEMIIDWVRVYQ